MQTNESSECQNQPDAAQVHGIVKPWLSPSEPPADLQSVIGWARLCGDRVFFSHEVYRLHGQWLSVRPREIVAEIKAWMPMPTYPSA